MLKFQMQKSGRACHGLGTRGTRQVHCNNHLVLCAYADSNLILLYPSPRPPLVLSGTRVCVETPADVRHDKPGEQTGIHMQLTATAMSPVVLPCALAHAMMTPSSCSTVHPMWILLIRICGWHTCTRKPHSYNHLKLHTQTARIIQIPEVKLRRNIKVLC